jgi:hypothetical protein
MQTDSASPGGNATLHPVVSEHHALELFGSDAGKALSLPELAREINKEHDAMEGHARGVIERARAAGDWLLLAKSRVRHGQWLPWLTANCPRVSVRRSQECMRVAREWPALQAKCADSAYLTIDGALALLAEPTPEPEPLPLLLSAPPTPVPPPAPAAPPPAPAAPPKQESPVEKINREHQQCQAKAREAARHELTLGKMLLAVKASMNDDQWAAWLAEQQQSGAMTFSTNDAQRALWKAERAKAEAERLVANLKELRWFHDRELLLRALATPEQAREVRLHWLVEDAADARRYVSRLLEELHGQPDMQRWLQVDSLTRALEKADTAARRVKTWPNEPGERDRRALFEQAKAMLATTEGRQL